MRQHDRRLAATRKYFATATWRGTWQGEGGGVLLNQAPHNLDLLCHLVGLPARLVAWTRTTMHDIETEDTVQTMMEWPDGAVGSLHVSTAESGQPERLEIPEAPMAGWS
ncbi:MAG: Gfo/Idh/MocA family oxidoreductase [Caldilineaceae bacterium]